MFVSAWKLCYNWVTVNKDKINAEINNLIALRTIYFSIVVVLTGGIIGLLYNYALLNFCLFIVGSILDFIYLTSAYETSKKINVLIKELRG